MHRKSAYILFIAVLGVLVIGIVMLFSTSAFAHEAAKDNYIFVKRQAGWLGVGLMVCPLASLVDYHFWQRTWWIWLGLAVVTLALCFVPHVGVRLNGSRRWIGHGALRFQPSEMAKIAIIIFLAFWYSRFEKNSSKPIYGFVLPLVIIAPVVVLI